MTWQDWATLGGIAFVAIGVWRGIRKGKYQFAAHTQKVATEARAEGAAEAMAAMQASLQQHVTVVAGNSERRDRMDDSASASRRVLDGVRAHLPVPDLAEGQAVVHQLPVGRDVDALYRQAMSHAPECDCQACMVAVRRARAVLERSQGSLFGNDHGEWINASALSSDEAVDAVIADLRSRGRYGDTG